MRATLPELERARVMVVGDAILDHYRYGPTSRISPEVSAPAVKVDTIEERPSGATNMAINITSLGANSRLVGLTSIDDVARALNKMLTDVNVKCDFVSVSIHPMITELRVLSRNQQPIRLDFEEDFEGMDPQLLRERISRALGSIDALILSDYVEDALAGVQQIAALTRKAGVPVLIDPKGTDFERYRGATLLTPNLSEFEAVAGECKNEDELVGCGMRVIADFDLSALLITRSEQGMTLLQPDESPLYMPTQTQEVYDVTGASDTAIGVLAAALAVGSSLEETCYFANAAVGVVVGKLRVSTVSSIELENAMRGRASTSFGVTSESELKQIVASARKRDKRMVMTNGVFDILHVDHVSYLTSARKLDDRLIMAVNSDASTKRLKGETCPVNSLEQRVIVLGTLEPVDWVISFGEDTPQRLIADIPPNPLVKGDDYKPEQIADSEEVWANGGEVLTLSFEDSYPTTSVIKKIQKDSNK